MMTVEERMGPVPRDAAPGDQFPVGMRVLAVDDDPTCLRVLDSLLRLCQYHVTTTNQAVTALRLLRENWDKFDLVISDVHMPDMDGFKLLELVGLEMDLPVIMLSANSDTKVVMKGITHGACDYLLKPVRIEELRNIWQHVVRKKKIDTRDLNHRDHGDNAEKCHHLKSDSRHSPDDETSDRNCNLNKRKDRIEEEEDPEESGHEDEDPCSQKKPRVVWSKELHKKFVDAVEHLGPDKAVPKRILELMNIERLTRENVASHLQKYRLGMKRIQAVESQKANIFAAIGIRDSYLPVCSMDGLGNFNAMARPRQLTPFQTGATVGRLNSPTGFGLHGISSSGIIPMGHLNNNMSNSTHIVGSIPQINLPGIPNRNLFPGLPTILERNNFQQQKLANKARHQLHDCTSDPGSLPGNSNKLFCNNAGNNFILQQQSSELPVQSSCKSARLQAGSLNVSVGTPNLPDLSNGAASLSGYLANTLSPSMPSGIENLSFSTIPKDRISPTGAECGSSHDASNSNIIVPTMMEQLATSCQHQAYSGDARVLSMPTGVIECPISNFGTASTQQKWEEDMQEQLFRPSIECRSQLNPISIGLGTITTDIPNKGQVNMFCDKRMDAGEISQSSSYTHFKQHFEAEKSDKQKANGDSFLQPSKYPAELGSNNCNSFEELMSTMIKMESDDFILMDNEQLGFDMYSLETCM